MEIPTTLPTFDELLGRPGFPDDRIVPHYLSLLRTDALNVLTIHAEIEGMGKLALFRDLLRALGEQHVAYVRLETFARQALDTPETPRIRDLILAPIEGRSGRVATESEPRAPHAAPVQQSN